ncbi:hypothetical protein [Streptomyces sp. NBC_01304]|uniref:hypothetical protein n=1 Tax=Streptomyces sp. NBC_01304 TaxID=2903818 RepID=UPI002E10EF02|nr:hypothetical protein OG430_44885 [Streptomyces sp. NBC_01304]
MNKHLRNTAAAFIATLTLVCAQAAGAAPALAETPACGQATADYVGKSYGSAVNSPAYSFEADGKAYRMGGGEWGNEQTEGTYEAKPEGLSATFNGHTVTFIARICDDQTATPKAILDTVNNAVVIYQRL